MIYRFRIILDAKDDIFRDVELDASSTFEDLHNTIIQSFGMSGHEMATFYVTDREWNQGEAIALTDMFEEPSKLMHQTALYDVFTNDQKTRMIAAINNFRSGLLTSNGCSNADYGCTDQTAYNYSPVAIFNDGSCCYDAGCMDPTAVNYNPTVCYDDGSCIAVVEGCTTPSAANYNELANTDDLSFFNNKFDLVHFGFCLYLVSRNKINDVIKQADQLLKSGKFLSIIDFDPHNSYENEYSHFKGLKSYKENYYKMFCDLGNYSVVNKFSYSEKSFCFSKNENDRISLVLLFKENK